jgi:hypothetical protein
MSHVAAKGTQNKKIDVKERCRKASGDGARWSIPSAPTGTNPAGREATNRFIVAV